MRSNTDYRANPQSYQNPGMHAAHAYAEHPYAVAAPGQADAYLPLTQGELHHIIATTGMDVERKRGLSGTKLACFFGGLGACVAGTGGVAAVVGTGGTAAVAAPAVAAGVTAVGGGAVLGALKNWRGRHQVRNNPELMGRVGVLLGIEAGLRQQAQIRLAQGGAVPTAHTEALKALGKIHRRVDASTLGELGKLAKSTAGGVTAGTVGVVVAVGVIALMAAAGGDGGGDGAACICWGGGPDLDIGSFNTKGPGPGPEDRHADSGVRMTRATKALFGL